MRDEFGLVDYDNVPETTVFAGLGMEPALQKPIDVAEVPSKSVVEQEVEAPFEPLVIEDISPVSKKVAPPPGFEASNETAFPALPKATPSVVPTTKFSNSQAAAAINKDKKIEELTEATSTMKAASPPAVDTEEPPTKNKRQHPGKLDITAATKIVPIENPATTMQGVNSKPGTPLLTLRDLATTPSTISRPTTPALPLDTPIKRSAQPRTIRVLATPKTEVSASAALPTSRASPGPIKQLSRQPSIASITIPGTPLSEKISDTVSVTTDSVSRADSPPPSRVGTAPVRTKTKSQLKKDRERAKLAADEKAIGESEESPSVETVTQEPIIGRKKKTKKPATVTTATSTPGPSRPTSPGPLSKGKSTPVVEAPIVIKEHQERAPPLETKKSAQNVAAQEPPATTNFEATKKAPSFPASVIADLQTSGDFDAATLNLFKAMPGLNHRHDVVSADLANANAPAQLTNEELARLDVGQPVRRGGADGRASSRVLITPLRMCLRGLTPEMEDRYLELERRVSASRPPSKFNHRRDAAATTALMVEEILKDLAAALTQPSTNAATAATHGNDENGGNGVRAAVYGDDALAYLNQFILPPLPPSRGKAGDASSAQSSTSPFSNGIPRTYTTGDPTYSVYGVDIAGANTHTISGYGADSIAAAAAANAAGLADRAAALSNLTAGPDAGGDPAAIKKALANAVNGVIAATAAVAGAAGGMAGAGAGGFGRRVGDKELEAALEESRRECEKLEKRLAGFLRKNRKIAGL